MQDAGNNNRPSTSSEIGYWYVLGPALRQAHGPVENNTIWGPELFEGPPKTHHNSTATSLRLAMISHGAL